MSRSAFVYAHSMQFQRGQGKVRATKRKQKMPLKVKQMFLVLGLASLGFFAVYKGYLFVISWENLEVRDVRVSCPDETVRAEVARMVDGRRWGNIFLLDISQMQTRIESFPWVKNARIRKVFPSSVKIEVTSREPAALLQKDGLYLIDQEGVELEKAEPGFTPDLPLLFDERHFIQDSQEKVALAWECLKSLSAEDRADVEMLDLSASRNVVLKFRSGPTRLELGDDLFAQKIALYHEKKDFMQNEFGPPEYVNLRIPDRIYFKPAERSGDENNILQPDKEGR